MTLSPKGEWTPDGMPARTLNTEGGWTPDDVPMRTLSPKGVDCEKILYKGVETWCASEYAEL